MNDYSLLWLKLGKDKLSDFNVTMPAAIASPPRAPMLDSADRLLQPSWVIRIFAAFN